MLKKFVLIALLMAICLAVFPVTAASAAGQNGLANAQPEKNRLEKVWAREQAVYKRVDHRLNNANNFITKAQTLINKANGKGWDTSSIQAALNSVSAVIPAAQAALGPGAAIIANHAGFDTSGNVTDRATAITTTKSLAKILKDTHTAMNGTGKALHEAIKAFRAAHPRPTTPPGH
jgi:hypothetical protein